jgi:hypothetical protein
MTKNDEAGFSSYLDRNRAGHRINKLSIQDENNTKIISKYRKECISQNHSILQNRFGNKPIKDVFLSNPVNRYKI